MLIIDETGDRKDGTQTAHVGRQYLGNRGKTEQGVVSVGSLWADEGVYYPLAVEPYTPEHWFPLGKADPAFRTKPQIALELVDQALAQDWPLRAVVADSFYGEHAGFTSGLTQRGVPYVAALKPSHSWWAPETASARSGKWRPRAAGSAPSSPAPGSRWRGTTAMGTPRRGGRWRGWLGRMGRPRAAGWSSPRPIRPPCRSRRRGIWRPRCPWPEADLAEIVRLYGLRNWVEQQYKHVKAALGWSQYQVRSDRAMRRHWALVQCAFAFCWWAETHAPPPAPPATARPDAAPDRADGPSGERGGKGDGPGSGVAPAVALLARGAAAGARLAGTGLVPVALLDGLERPAPPPPLQALLDWLRARPPAHPL